MALNEVLPGVFHWRTRHPNIGSLVDSYWVEQGSVLIDPLVPRQGIGWFEQRPQQPAAIILSNRHHYRDSQVFIDEFRCGPVHVPATGLHEFTDGQPVVGYKPGDLLPGGLESVAIGVLAPDDGALYLPRLHALWFADSVVRSPSLDDGPLGFVPDSLMDEPTKTKRGILDAIERIVGERSVEHLLLAHGGPVIGTGERQLRELTASGGRTIEL